MSKKSVILFFSLLLLLLICPSLSHAQVYRELDNYAFQRGEILTYRVFWDAWLSPKIKAGELILKITDEKREYHNRPTYNIVASGQTTGLLNIFYKVRDRYESYIDEQGLFSWNFIRNTREGSYKRKDNVAFIHKKNIAVGKHGSSKIPDFAQDILSAIYYFRSLDFSETQPGDEYNMDFFLDDSVYVSRIKFLGREALNTSFGKISCLKFKPRVLVGPVFTEPYPLTIWVTDDSNLIPVLVISKVLVGSVKVELMDFQGLRNPGGQLQKSE